MFNKIFQKVDTIKSDTYSSFNELTISLQNSYSNFTKSVEKFYDWFCTNMHNMLTCLLACDKILDFYSKRVYLFVIWCCMMIFLTYPKNIWLCFVYDFTFHIYVMCTLFILCMYLVCGFFLCFALVFFIMSKRQKNIESR